MNGTKGWGDFIARVGGALGADGTAAVVAGWLLLSWAMLWPVMPVLAPWMWSLSGVLS